MAWGGRTVAGIEDLQRMLSEAQPDSPLTVTVVRGAEKHTLEVVPADRPVAR